MPPSSQSGSSQQPDPSSPRRLQTPEERFGTPSPLQPETPPDPFIAQPASKPRPRSGARPKPRHERGRFEREARHLPPRRAAHSRRAPKSNSSAAPVSSQRETGVPAPDLPALSRARANRRRAWKRVGAFALVALGAGAVGAAFYAPQMNIERVHINGLHATSPVLVEPIAARLLGHNLFRADKNAVAQAAARLPTVANARVLLHAEVPPRVELRVVERIAVMRIGDGAQWWVADKNGLTYRTANARDAALTAITWSGRVQTMKPLEPKRWADALRLRAAIEEQTRLKSGAGLGLRAIELDANGEATLRVASIGDKRDLTLKLGADQWSEKLARARVAVNYFARTKRPAAELNLISLDLPRWTPRGVSGQTPGVVPSA